MGTSSNIKRMLSYASAITLKGPCIAERCMAEGQLMTIKHVNKYQQTNISSNPLSSHPLLPTATPYPTNPCYTLHCRINSRVRYDNLTWSRGSHSISGN